MVTFGGVAETSNPRKSLPTAIKRIFWRITLLVHKSSETDRIYGKHIVKIDRLR